MWKKSRYYRGLTHFFSAKKWPKCPQHNDIYQQFFRISWWWKFYELRKLNDTTAISPKTGDDSHPMASSSETSCSPKEVKSFEQSHFFTGKAPRFLGEIPMKWESPWKIPSISSSNAMISWYPNRFWPICLARLPILEECWNRVQLALLMGIIMVMNLSWDTTPIIYAYKLYKLFIIIYIYIWIQYVCVYIYIST